MVIRRLCFFEFAEDGAAEDEDGTEQLGRGQTLVQEQGREDQSGNRVHIADEGDGLGGQLLQACKIQQVSEARVHKADGQKPGDVRARRMGKACSQQNIDQHDGEGDIQFHGGGLQAVGQGNALVEDDEGRVEQRRSGGHQETRDAHAGGGDTAADADEANSHDDDGRDGEAAELFTEEQGGEEQHEHGTGIVDQGGQTDIQKAVSGEKRDPVQGEGDTAAEKETELGLYRVPAEAAAEKDQRGQQQAA